jgi:hypothetical protein
MDKAQEAATQAALARSRSFNDGVRRVVPVKDQTISLGTQCLSFRGNEIIDDVHRIKIMETHGVEFLELNVNDKKNRPIADESKGEMIVRQDNVMAFARALGVDKDVLCEGLFGKQVNIERAAGLVKDVLAGVGGPDHAELIAFRKMLEARARVFITALAGEEYLPHFFDGLTGDPNIDLKQFAEDLYKMIGDAAQPTGETVRDAVEVNAELAAAETAKRAAGENVDAAADNGKPPVPSDPDFIPGTPQV